MPQPEDVLKWWNVVNTVGLPGVLIAEIGLIVWLARKYVPAALDTWKEWTIAINDLTKELTIIKGICEDAKRDQKDSSTGK